MVYMPETQFSMTLKKIWELFDYLKKYSPGDIDDTKKKYLREEKAKIQEILKPMGDKPEKQLAISFINRYKEIKREADASDARNMAKLKQLLIDSHQAAEEEIKKNKTCIETAVKAAAQTIDAFFQTNIASLNSWMPNVTKGLTELNDTYLLAINEIEKKLKGFTNKTDKTIIISQFTAKLQNITEELQKVFAKYALSKTEQVKGLTKDFNEFPCCAAFIRILMGIAGISSKKDPASGEKEGKEYVKIFGRGYLAKATYTAVTNIHDSYGEPKAEKSAVAERPMVEV